MEACDVITEVWASGLGAVVARGIEQGPYRVTGAGLQGAAVLRCGPVMATRLAKVDVHGGL